MPTIIDKLKSQFSRLNSYLSPDSLYFIPAVFFLTFGICALVAPSLLIGLVAGFSIFLGFVAAVIAWRFLILKKKFDRVLKQFDGKVLVHSMHVEPDFEEEELFDIEDTQLFNKKVTYH